MDLKRALEPKLALLQRRTGRSMAAIRRELLQAENDDAAGVASGSSTSSSSSRTGAGDGGQDDIVSRINAQTARDAEDSDSDDDSTTLAR